MLSRTKVRTHSLLRYSISASFRLYHSKVTSVNDAIKGIQSNTTLLCGGFGLSGVPDTLINELVKAPHINNLTAVSNNAGIDGCGLSQLLSTGQVKKMIASYIGGNKTCEKM